MNDRIANLRALRRAEQNAHKDNDLVTWAPTADTIRHALYINCDALLDCAEALQKLVEYAKDSQGIAGYHLNGAILEWDDVEELHAGMNALAKLNGESDAD